MVGAKWEECELCQSLARAGVAIRPIGAVPPEAAALEVLDPTDGRGDHRDEFRRCPRCAALYRYRLTYDFDVTGSSDEETLRRLGDEEQRVLGPAFDATRGPEEQDRSLAAALGHPDPALRREAALAALFLARQSHPLPVSRHAAVVVLGDDDVRTVIDASHALQVIVARHGPEAAAPLRAELGRRTLEHYGRQVLKACDRVLAPGERGSPPEVEPRP